MLDNWLFLSTFNSFLVSSLRDVIAFLLLILIKEISCSVEKLIRSLLPCVYVDTLLLYVRANYLTCSTTVSLPFNMTRGKVKLSIHLFLRFREDVSSWSPSLAISWLSSRKNCLLIVFLVPLWYQESAVWHYDFLLFLELGTNDVITLLHDMLSHLWLIVSLLMATSISMLKV